MGVKLMSTQDIPLILEYVLALTLTMPLALR